MVKKIMGKINKRVKQDVTVHLNSNNKADNESSISSSVSAPPSKGIGAVYKDDEDF